MLKEEKEWGYSNGGQTDLCRVLPAVRQESGLCNLSGHRRRHRRGKCHLDHLPLRGCPKVLYLFPEQFIDGLSIRKYAEAHQLNRDSVDHLQKKFFSALACLLKERDEAEELCQLRKPVQK